MLLSTGQYFGKATRKLEISGLILTQSCYEVNTDIPLHYHQNPHFCYFIAGGCSEFTSKKEIQCAPGELIIHPYQIEHKNHYYDKVTRLLHIEFDSPCYQKLTSHGINFNNVNHLHHPSLSRIFRKIYNEMNFQDSFTGLTIESLVYELIVTISKQDPKEKTIPYNIKKVIDLMHDHFNHPIHLEYLATFSGVHAAHLSRQFKKATGFTVGEYMRQIRIKKACALLKNTSNNILSIAIDCGFSDQSHFTQVFVKTTGITPSKYRKEENLKSFI